MLLKLGVPVIKKLLEMQIAIEKENLEAFRVASKNMEMKMAYQMAIAVKTVVKNHKGAMKVRDNFLKLLEDLCSFTKDKIPMRTLKKMQTKNLAFGTASDSKLNEMAYQDLKRNSPGVFEAHMKGYKAFVLQKKKDKEAAKAKGEVAEVKSGTQGLLKVSGILEAFVIKVNFSLKKVFFGMLDDKNSVCISS